MVLKFVSWIAMVAVGLLVMLFAISNRTLVTLDLWPLPVPEVTVPHYVPVLAAAFSGFVGGAIVAWFSAGKVRRRARTASKKASGLEKNLNKLKQQIEELESLNKNVSLKVEKLDVPGLEAERHAVIIKK